MIRKEADWAVDVFENFKDGQGTTTIQKFLNNEEFYGKGRMFAQFKISPNGSIGVHQHIGEQEIYFITKGKGEYTDNDKVYEVSEGDVLICQDGENHGIKNIGQEELVYTALILFTK